MWEENPVGDWTLEILNDGRIVAELKTWSISFSGTKESPQPGLPATGALPTPPEAKVGKEVDLNQAPKVPEQGAADVSQLHHAGKNIAENPAESVPIQPQIPDNYHADHCLDSTRPEWCMVCEAGFVLLNGRCVESCPSEGYYVGKESAQDSCIQCYYSCKTCHGPNDYQVINFKLKSCILKKQINELNFSALNALVTLSWKKSLQHTSIAITSHSSTGYFPPRAGITSSPSVSW